jgi:hypothetical protein
VQGEVADDNLIAGRPAQLTCQTVVVEAHAGVSLPVILDDCRGLAEALGEVRRADLPAEHAVRGPPGCRSVHPVEGGSPLPPTSPCYPFAGVDDVAGVAILGLPACVKEPFLGRRAPWVGGTLSYAARVHRGLGALRTPIVPRAPLLADAGRRAFGLLDGRLLDERLRLAV